MAYTDLTPKLNHIYCGDCVGDRVFETMVGGKQIHNVLLTDIDYIDKRTCAGLIGKTATGAIIGGLVAGPFGELAGIGLAAHSWNKKFINVYRIELEFGEGLKGNAWVDEKTLNYLKNRARLDAAKKRMEQKKLEKQQRKAEKAKKV